VAVAHDPAETPGFEAAAGDRLPGWIAGAIAGVLAVQVMARGALVFSGTMVPWGLNVGRFLDPAVHWTLWAVAALALVPRVAASWLAPLDRAGDFIARAPAGPLAAAVVSALAVFSLPDRTWFTGDFVQRLGAAWVPGAFDPNFIAALPLDYLLHGVLGGLVSRAAGADAMFGFRVFGALQAATLAVLAVSFARLRGDRGAVAVMVVAVIVFGGHLVTFTGMGKPASAMCVLAAGMGILAARVVRDGTGLGWLGVAMAIGLLLHRSAIVLLPMWIVTWGLGVRRSPPAAPRAAIAVGLILPLAVGALLFGRITSVLTGYDVSHHVLTAEVGRLGGPLRAAVHPFRLSELANFLIAMSPVVPLMPVLLAAVGRPPLGTPALRMPLILAFCFVPVWVLVHPQQGIFRDWDVLAPAAVSLLLLAASSLAEVLNRAPGSRWLTVPVTVAVVVSSLGWLIHFHDPARGLTRVQAYAQEDRHVPDWVEAWTWDFLTHRNMSQGRWREATEAAAHAARFAPHRRILLMWGMAATRAGDHDQARRAYRMLLQRVPDDPLAWLGLGGVAARDGDSLGVREALSRLGRYAPGSAEAREIRRHLGFFPEAWPDSLPPNLRAN
jgi:hypothetical protein